MHFLNMTKYNLISYNFLKLIYQLIDSIKLLKSLAPDAQPE